MPSPTAPSYSNAPPDTYALALSLKRLEREGELSQRTLAEAAHRASSLPSNTHMAPPHVTTADMHSYCDALIKAVQSFDSALKTWRSVYGLDDDLARCFRTLRSSWINVQQRWQFLDEYVEPRVMELGGSWLNPSLVNAMADDVKTGAESANFLAKLGDIVGAKDRITYATQLYTTYGSTQDLFTLEQDIGLLLDFIRSSYQLARHTNSLIESSNRIGEYLCAGSDQVGVRT
jgi:hypothetical protein